MKFCLDQKDFGKVHNKSCQKIHPFGMASTNVTKIQQIFNKTLQFDYQNLAKIFQLFTEINKKLPVLKNFRKFNKISNKLTKFHDSK